MRLWALKSMWLAFALVVAYGSVYPFHFRADGLDPASLLRFLASCCQRQSRADVLANVLLFMPFGLLGALALHPGTSRGRRLWHVCLAGAGFALALQMVQILVPSRDANLQDVGWNLLGTAAGALFGLFYGGHLPHAVRRGRTLHLAPCILIGSWLTYRLIPFVPSLDVGMVWSGLTPLWRQPLDPFEIARDAVAWTIVAYALRHGQRDGTLDAYLPILIVFVFGLEVLIVDNSVNASNLVGAILAVGLWWGFIGRARRPESALLIALACLILVNGLAPFTLRERPIAFNWLPFHGFLGGTMLINVKAACLKVFLYGALAYLLWRRGVGLLGGTLSAVALVAAVEFAQTVFVAHTPEITDPILVAAAAAALMTLQRRDEPSNPR